MSPRTNGEPNNFATNFFVLKYTSLHSFVFRSSICLSIYLGAVFRANLRIIFSTLRILLTYFLSILNQHPNFLKVSSYVLLFFNSHILNQGPINYHILQHTCLVLKIYFITHVHQQNTHKVKLRLEQMHTNWLRLKHQ